MILSNQLSPYFDYEGQTEICHINIESLFKSAKVVDF